MAYNKGAEVAGSKEPVATPVMLSATQCLNNCDKILVACGFTERAKQARDAALADNQRNTVILVGEVNRGKSSLANALVGSENTSPAGSGFTTVVPVAIGPATDAAPAGSVALANAEGEKTVSAEELSRWVDRANQTDTDFIPTRAYVGLGQSLMGEAVVIDTPGIGGIDPLGPMARRDTDTQASVVVVVTDATGPLTQPEMDFLVHAAEESVSVIVAVTKTDKNLTRWRSIVVENEALIAQHVGMNIPVVGVSSRIAFLPQFAGERHKAEELGGIAELRALIAQRFSQARGLPLANALRIAARTLAQISEGLAEEISGLEQPAEAIPELARELERLEELERNSKKWEQYFNRNLELASQQAMDNLDQNLRAVRKKWTDYISANGVQVLRKDPQYYTRLMEEDFQRAVAESVDGFGADAETLIRNQFGDAEQADQVIEQIRSELTSQQPLRTGELKRNTKDVFDPVMLMMGVSGGSMLGAVLGVASLGVGLIGGAGWFAVNFGFRAMRQSKSQLLNWIGETTNSAKMAAGRAIRNFVLVTSPLVSEEYSNYLNTEIPAVRGKIQQLEKTKRLQQDKREKKLSRLTNNRNVVDKQRRTAEDFVARLTEEGAR